MKYFITTTGTGFYPPNTTLDIFFPETFFKKVYKRPFNENQAVEVLKLDENRVKYFANVIGMNKEDIEVRILHGNRGGEWILDISGSTEHELGEYSINYQIPFYMKVKSDISATLKNGILEVILERDTSSDPEFNITLK